MNPRDVTPGIFPTQHADPEAAHRRAMMERNLASEALGIGFERRRVEESALVMAHQTGRDEGREEGYAQRFAEDYRWGIVVGTAWTVVACALLAVALAVHNAPGCLP